MHDGAAVLELGTGWIHWESLIVRLFCRMQGIRDVRVTLFDVWDNRALDALKQAARELERVVDDTLMVEPPQRGDVHALLQQAAAATSFEQLYDLLSFTYVIEPSGALWGFADASFDLLYSCNVLEHVRAEILQSYVADFGRLLKPGGYSIHTIDISDHLAHYDRTAPKKEYLSFSDRAWKSFYENEVQYFNRVQRSEWLGLFRSAGLELVDQESTYTALRNKVDGRYAGFDEQDLSCITLKVVHRKPGVSGQGG